ncbi:Ig-like domain-containing protein, partial [Vibrio splendidus]|uniref:Ig-like domain-containing protein n=2 Tax=Vibrio splendidus TaxID=29497 RepID=UPI000D4381D3
TDGDMVTVTLTGPGGYSHVFSTTVAQGVWSVTFDGDNALSTDGKYSWTMEAVDVAGNTQVTEGKFTLDTVAPSAATELLNDSGFVSNDGITKNDELSIKVTTTGNAYDVRLVVWKQGETVNEAVFDSTHQLSGSQDHTFTTSQLGEGHYQYKVIVTDAAGNVSESAVASVEIDTTLPMLGSVSLDDTENGTYVNDPEVSFSGTAEAGSRVYLTLTDSKGANIVVDPAYVEATNGSWVYALPPEIASQLEDGTYQWSFVAQDIAGNRSAEEAGSFTLDTTLPELTFNGLSADTDSGDDSSDMLTNSDAPVFTGTVTENAKVTVTLTAIPAGKSYTFETSGYVTGAWSLAATSAIEEGTYNVTVTALDMAGNTSDAVVSDTNLVIDRTVTGGEDVGLHGDSDSGESGDELTNHTTIKLTGNVEAGSTVTLKNLSTPSNNPVDVSSVASVSADGRGNWEITLPSFGGEQGVYNYTIEYVDVAGNSKEVSGSYELDTHISITATLDAGQVEQNGVLFTKDDTPTFKGTGTKGDKITLTVSGPGGSQEFTAEVDDKGVWSIDSTALGADGVYNWSIVAMDAAGNTDRSQSGNFTLDTTPPSFESLELLTDTGVSASDGITKDNTPDLKVVTSGQAHQVKLLVWEASGSSSSATYDSGFVTVDNNGSYTFTVPALDDGSFNYQVIVVDIAGNEASSTIESMTIDTEVPILGNVELNGAENGGFVNDEQLVFSGSGAEANARVYLSLTDSRGTPVTLSPAFVTVASDGTWTFPIQDGLDLADGTYTWSVYAQDAAGNDSAVQTGSAIIDTQAPIVTFAGLTEATDSGNSNSDMVTNTLRPVFTGNVTESAKVKVVLVQGAQRIEFEADTYSNGEWTLTVPQDIPEGTWSVTVSATDKAGNMSSSVVSDVDLVIDRTVVGGDDHSLSSDTDSGESDSDNITNQTTVKLSGTVEAGTKVTLTALEKPDGSTVVLPTDVSTTAGSNGVWTLDIPTFGDLNGEYTYSLRYEDIAGNTRTVSGTFTFDDDIQLTAQFDSETGRLNDVVYTSEKEPVLSGSGDNGDKIQVVITGPGGLQTLTAVVGSDGTWTVTADEIEQDGSYTWKVTATDVAGNQSEVEGSFTLDSVAPTATTSLENDSGFEADDNLTNNDALEISVSTLGDAHSATLMVWASGNPSNLLVEDKVVLTGAGHLFTTAALPEGSYQYKVVVTDIAGNTSDSDVVTVVIDKTAP